MNIYGDYINNRLLDRIEELYQDFDFPLYVYDEETIINNVIKVQEVIPYEPFQLRYACKANTNATILALMRQCGVKIDAVSMGEIFRCFKAGFTEKDILFTSEDHHPDTLFNVVVENVMVNCSSLETLDNLGRFKQELADLKKDICVRINPGIPCGFHKKVETAGEEASHGIWHSFIPDIKTYVDRYSLSIKGFHSHAGSGFDVEKWLVYVDHALKYAAKFDGLEFINLGGGLPVPYKPGEKEFDLEQFGIEISEKMENFSRHYGSKVRLELEPGRYLVANAGVLFAQVTAVKETPNYTFASINTGFQHLVRPMMYGAYHPIAIVTPEQRPKCNLMLSGNLCETDFFTVDKKNDVKPRMLVEPELFDFVAIGNAGAYCMSMASNYNSFRKPAEVLLGVDDKFYLIREKETFEDLIKDEEKRIPLHLRCQH